MPLSLIVRGKHRRRPNYAARWWFRRLLSSSRISSVPHIQLYLRSKARSRWVDCVATSRFGLRQPCSSCKWDMLGCYFAARSMTWGSAYGGLSNLFFLANLNRDRINRETLGLETLDRFQKVGGICAKKFKVYIILILVKERQITHRCQRTATVMSHRSSNRCPSSKQAIQI